MLNQQEHFGHPRSEMGKPSTAFATGGLFLVMLPIPRDENGRFLKDLPRPKRDWKERFWEKVNKDGPIPHHRPELGQCWIWTASAGSKWYGYFRLNGEFRSAHRISFFLEHGRWALNTLHACDQSKCVRPSHLFEGTHLDNMRDCKVKGRLNHKTLYGEDASNAKLTWGLVDQIRFDRLTLKMPLADICKKYDIAISSASLIANNKQWKPEHRPS